MKTVSLGVLGLVLLLTSMAHAQEPKAHAPPLDERPIRTRRPLSIGGEVGWNGLAGLGVNFSYHPLPYLAFDTGLGLGAAGWKGGLRVRANLLSSAWTPIVGAGFLYALGSGGEAVEVTSSGETAKVEVLKSPYAQLVAGVNYTGDGGFVFTATTGYAILLKDNTRLVSGSRAAYDDLRPVVGSGLVLSGSLGYAF